MKKKIAYITLTAVIVLVAFFIGRNTTEPTCENEQFIIINSNNLTDDMLIERTKQDTIIIEKITGTCIDAEKNGQIAEGGYISYKSMENVQSGDTVTTYCVYNPETAYTDDIIARFDIIGKER